MSGGKGATLSAGLLALIYHGTTIANLAENASSSPLTNLYWSLHTAAPGPSGNQSTSEAAYTGYARVPVARSTLGTSLSGTTINPVATVQWPTASGGSETEAYFGVGTASSGAGVLLDWGPISPTIAVTSGVTPQLTTATAITEG